MTLIMIVLLITVTESSEEISRTLSLQPSPQVLRYTLTSQCRADSVNLANL